jgi:hypothetical protein
MIPLRRERMVSGTPSEGEPSTVNRWNFNDKPPLLSARILIDPDFSVSLSEEPTMQENPVRAMKALEI